MRYIVKDNDGNIKYIFPEQVLNRTNTLNRNDIVKILFIEMFFLFMKMFFLIIFQSLLPSVIPEEKPLQKLEQIVLCDCQE
jgi:hypothetical protein